MQNFRRIFSGCFFVVLLLYVGGVLFEFYGFSPALLSRIQFVPALLAGSLVVVISILLFTLIFGRWYCSFLCPLGVFQDILGRIRKNKIVRTIGVKATFIRYFILFLCFISFFFGASIVLLLVDPWSVFGRLTTTFALPVFTFVNNLLAQILNNFGMYGVVIKDYNFAGFSVLLIASLSMFFLCFFVFIYGGRFWCNTLCPVGTVLSIVAKKSLMQVHIDRKKCVSCGLCEKQCKAGVISLKSKQINAGDCVSCFNCLPVCRDDAIYYGFSKRDKSA